MSGRGSTDYRDLLERLTEAIEEWEFSPYYLHEEELFDLERFLDDHDAGQLKAELEKLYGKPLNQRFWTSMLAYHRLRKARDEVKARDAEQDEKRRKYVEAEESEKKDRQELMKEWIHQQRREQLRVLPGGKGTKTN